MDLLTRFMSGSKREHQRLKVVDGTPAFDEGRLIVNSHEFAMNSGEIRVYELQHPTPVLIDEIHASLVSGALAVRTYCLEQGSPGGVFDQPVQLSPTNRMSSRAVRSSMNYGGTFTPTTLPGCVLRMDAASKAGGVTGDNHTLRGVSANDTIYFVFECYANGTVGTVRFLFEELDQWVS